MESSDDKVSFNSSEERRDLAENSNESAENSKYCKSTPEKKRSEKKRSWNYQRQRSFELMEDSALAYIDYDQVDSDSATEDGWIPLKKSTQKVMVDYREELDIFKGTSPERKKRGKKSSKKKKGKKSARKKEKNKEYWKKVLSKGGPMPLCQFYREGNCLKGDECWFSHVLPTKCKKLCKFYVFDSCNESDSCRFMHSEFPCKYYHTGVECFAEECRFSHSPLTQEMKDVLHRHLNPPRVSTEESQPMTERRCILENPPVEMSKVNETQGFPEQIELLQPQIAVLNNEVPVIVEKENEASSLLNRSRLNFYQDTFIDSTNKASPSVDVAIPPSFDETSIFSEAKEVSKVFDLGASHLTKQPIMVYLDEPIKQEYTNASESGNSKRSGSPEMMQTFPFNSIKKYSQENNNDRNAWIQGSFNLQCYSKETGIKTEKEVKNDSTQNPSGLELAEKQNFHSAPLQLCSSALPKKVKTEKSTDDSLNSGICEVGDSFVMHQENPSHVMQEDFQNKCPKNKLENEDPELFWTQNNRPLPPKKKMPKRKRKDMHLTNFNETKKSTFNDEDSLIPWDNPTLELPKWPSLMEMIIQIDKKILEKGNYSAAKKAKKRQLYKRLLSGSCKEMPAKKQGSEPSESCGLVHSKTKENGLPYSAEENELCLTAAKNPSTNSINWDVQKEPLTKGVTCPSKSDHDTK